MKIVRSFFPRGGGPKVQKQVRGKCKLETALTGLTAALSCHCLSVCCQKYWVGPGEWERGRTCALPGQRIVREIDEITNNRIIMTYGYLWASVKRETC